MIKETIKGILRDESLLKNLFSGIGYFVFAAGISKILLTYAQNDNWIEISSVLLAYIMLVTVATFFWLLHVIRPIVKITWPSFGIPGIDPEAKKLSYTEIAKRIDIWFYVVLAAVSIHFGWYLVRVVIGSTSS